MRLLKALTLIFAVIAALSPFVAIFLPAGLRALEVNSQSVISVTNAWVRPVEMSMSEHNMDQAVNQGTPTAAYMHIRNDGGAADTLLSAASDVAATVELHQTQIDDAGIARMVQQTSGLQIPGYSAIDIEPGGYHIMLSGLISSLQAGESILIRLTFASGTVIEVNAVVADFPPSP
ncbi:MAG: copper chaperone PCu(A)C [Anaerolineae bacterium]|nr:copper chaperone PCu(A)C [Anaerolineae bacterium]